MPELRAAARAASHQEPVLWRWGIAQLALVPVALVAMALDPRTVDGVDNWLKPTKFLIGGGIYCLTVALLLVPLTPGRPRTYIRWATAAGLAVEHLIIGIQAARAVPSHFVQSIDLNGLAYAVMGWAIAALTVGAVLLLVSYVRDPAARALPEPLRAGILAGIAISLIGSVAGGTMSGINSHSVGADSPEATTGHDGLPVVGWSTQHGDLRPAHFAGLHAIQILPALGWWLSRPASASAPAAIGLVASVGLGGPAGGAQHGRTGVVLAFATAYGAFVLALFVVALTGRPVVPL